LLSGKTFLVTGATGRIGCSLTERLEELGAKVLPLVLPAYPSVPEIVSWSAKTEPIPVSGSDDLENLPVPDHALHLHWWVDRTRPFSEQVVNELRWNVHDPSFLWEWLRKQPVPRFVNCSSIRIFGPKNQNPITRETEPLPVSPYGIAKLAGEKFLSAWFDDERTQVVHLRLGPVCSVGEHPSHLVSRLFSSAFEGERIQINSPRTVNLMHIDEAVDVLINAALTAPPGRYLAVTPERSIRDVAETFERLTGRTLDADHVDLAPGVPDPEFVSDLDSLRADWARVATLEEAITRIVEERTGSSTSSRPDGAGERG
jgi:nucleoside-diphosphate-sugar epimerase